MAMPLSKMKEKEGLEGIKWSVLAVLSLKCLWKYDICVWGPRKDLGKDLVLSS